MSAHVPHPAHEGGWRRPVDVPLSDEAWRSILALLPPAGERPSILPYPELGRAGQRRSSVWGRHVDHEPEPHWAFTADPVTGRVLDTAETSALLRSLRLED